MSTSRHWRFRVSDILDAIARIEHYTRGLNDAAFHANTLVADAVLHNLELIGEAVAALPPEVCSHRPDVPWSDIRGMRNFIAHRYFKVDLDIVWATIARDLPLLKSALEEIENIPDAD